MRFVIWAQLIKNSRQLKQLFHGFHVFNYLDTHNIWIQSATRHWADGKTLKIVCQGFHNPSCSVQGSEHLNIHFIVAKMYDYINAVLILLLFVFHSTLDCPFMLPAVNSVIAAAATYCIYFIVVIWNKSTSERFCKYSVLAINKQYGLISACLMNQIHWWSGIWDQSSTVIKPTDGCSCRIMLE